jgi:hypothetical protein
MNNYNFFIQAKNIFLNEQNLNISFGYNPEVGKMIALHILLPNETAKESEIGAGEGYQETEKDNGDIMINYNQGLDATYQIMITSDNSSEVLLIYNILKSLFLVFSPHLELMGLRNLKISGNDIVMRDEYTTAMLFHKVLNLSFFYELTVETNLVKKIANHIFITGTPIEEDEEFIIN